MSKNDLIGYLINGNFLWLDQYKELPKWVQKRGIALYTEPQEPQRLLHPNWKKITDFKEVPGSTMWLSDGENIATCNAPRWRFSQPIYYWLPDGKTTYKYKPPLYRE